MLTATLVTLLGLAAATPFTIANCVDGQCSQDKLSISGLWHPAYVKENVPFKCEPLQYNIEFPQNIGRRFPNKFTVTETCSQQKAWMYTDQVDSDKLTFTLRKDRQSQPHAL